MARSSTGGNSRGRGHLTVLVTVAVVLTVLCALIDFGFILNSIGIEHVNGSRGGQIAGAVVFLLVTLACSRWVIHLEHQLRGHTEVATSYAQTSRPRGDRSFPYRRRRKFGPTGTAIVGLLYLGGAAGAVIGAISSHSQAGRSNFVQHHGIAVLATIDHVANSESCGRSSCSYSAAVTVTLPRPIGGTTISIVHVPREFDLIAGEQVPILVDPRQPTYSELPGVKFKSPGEWILLLCIAVFLLALAVFDARRLARMLGHRSAHRKATSQGPKTVY